MLTANPYLSMEVRILNRYLLAVTVSEGSAQQADSCHGESVRSSVQLNPAGNRGPQSAHQKACSILLKAAAN